MGSLPTTCRERGECCLCQGFHVGFNTEILQVTMFFSAVNTLEVCDEPGGCGCCLLAVFDCILTDAEDGSEGEHHSW